MRETIQSIFDAWNEDFSGVYSVSGPDGVIFQQVCGYRNRAEKLPNAPDTAFGIASGTKLFTGLAICKLVDEKKLSLEDKLCDLLTYDLGQIDKRVTVRHLITHTSGVGDYIDEEADDSEEQLQSLYDKYPVQLWERLEYYLQMITPLPPKFEPGARCGYSNSGFILLGLVIEAVSGMAYQQYVQSTIIIPCDLTHTGFYRMDALPANTAMGYVQDEETDEWCTNIFSLPVVGGSDGGLFTCAEDLDKLWRAIFANKILSVEITGFFLGLYKDDDYEVYFAVGADSGVDFVTAYFPQSKIVVSALGNTDMNTFPLLEELLEMNMEEQL